MNIIGEAASHNELIDVLRARKEQLGLSNAWIEHTIQLADGHCDKVLGPARERGLSQLTIDGLLAVLAIKLVVVEDEAAVARMRPMWDGRDQKQVRPPSRIAKSAIARALPYAVRALGRAGGVARWRGVDPEVRRKLMTAVSRARSNVRKPVVAPRSDPAKTGLFP
jgi:hypothetical protein